VLREDYLGISVYMYFSYSFICLVTIQPLKSNWRVAPVKEVNRNFL
jgi:hypothetical protein